jgi:tripeptidyl-peptidase-1
MSQLIVPEVSSIFPHFLGIVIDKLSVQYDIPEASKSAPGNKLGIYESLDVHYSRADLDVYYSKLYP